jgi:hypothetical protein
VGCAEVDAVASGLFNGEVLDEHILAPGEDHAVPPFRLLIFVGLVVLFVHAQASGLAAGLLNAANGDMVAVVK